MTVLDYLLSIARIVPVALGNWFMLYNHQLRLALRYMTSDEDIRNRALQCLLPPTLLLLIILGSASLLVRKPGVVVWPAKKALPTIPWTTAAAGIALFAIVARPALWDHQCDNTPVRVNPNDRAQWRDVWTSFNAQRPAERSYEYRNRMEGELDEWEKRERTSGDLEEWINVSSQVIAKRDCLNQKDEIFRETWKQKRAEWETTVSEWWMTSVLREWWMGSLFQAEVCQPQTRLSRWASMVKRAKEFRFGRE